MTAELGVRHVDGSADSQPTIHVAINDLEVNQDTTILEGAIDLRFGSSAARETSIDLAFIGINLALTTDLSIVQDVAQFIKAPEGVSCIFACELTVGLCRCRSKRSDACDHPRR